MSIPAWWSDEQEEKVRQLRQIIPLTKELAGHYLHLSNWNVRLAHEAYSSETTEHKVERQHVLPFYARYCDKNDKTKMLSEGIDQLLHELHLAPSSIHVLLLAWKCNAQVQWIFTREEFIHGMLTLQADNTATLRQKLYMAEEDLQHEELFRDFYEFTFEYAQDACQRVLDIDMAIAYWKIVYEHRFVFLNEWFLFLKQTKKTSISKDSWNLLWDFVKNAEDNLYNYDINEAWPVIIDEFVQWFKEHQTINEKMSNDAT